MLMLFLASDASVSGLEAAAPLLETEADVKLATNDHGGSSAAEVALNAKAAPQTKGAKSAGDDKPASDSAMTAATKTESHAVRIPHHTCKYCLCWPTSVPEGLSNGDPSVSRTLPQAQETRKLRNREAQRRRRQRIMLIQVLKALSCLLSRRDDALLQLARAI